jgi:hypothetical protein
VQGVETEGNAGFDNTVVFDNAVVNGLRGPACSIQIALPWLQAHEALPVRYCGKAKDLPAVRTTLSRVVNACRDLEVPPFQEEPQGLRAYFVQSTRSFDMTQRRKSAASRHPAKAMSKKPTKAAKKTAATPFSSRRWSQRVTKDSDALDLKRGVFTLRDPKRVAASLKRSAERSSRRKTGAYRSALSMLTFYINRAGRTLPKTQRERLNRAKIELKRQFGRE